MVLAGKEGGWCRRFTEEAFRLHWTEERLIGTDDNMKEVLGRLRLDGDPFKMAAALTSGGQKAALADNDDSGGITLMHLFSYAEVSSDLESARRSGRLPEQRP